MWCLYRYWAHNGGWLLQEPRGRMGSQRKEQWLDAHNVGARHQCARTTTERCFILIHIGVGGREEP